MCGWECVTKAKRLTRKQFVWLTYYLGEAHFNATEAARLAGYKLPRISGPENLHKPAVQEAIAKWWASKGMTTDEVVARLAEQARAEYSAYIREDGTVDLAKMLANGKGHLIKGTRWDRNGNLTVEFYDAHAALVDVGKHLGIFTERVDVTSGGKPIKGYVTISPDDWDEDDGDEIPATD